MSASIVLLHPETLNRCESRRRRIRGSNEEEPGLDSVDAEATTKPLDLSNLNPNFRCRPGAMLDPGPATDLLDDINVGLGGQIPLIVRCVVARVYENSPVLIIQVRVVGPVIITRPPSFLAVKQMT